MREIVREVAIHYALPVQHIHVMRTVAQECIFSVDTGQKETRPIRKEQRASRV